mgnify:FL=1
MHIVIDSFLQISMILIKRSFHSLAIDRNVECYCENNDEDCRNAVAPYVNALVMEHKQTFNDFFCRVEIDSVAMCDVVIILHVGGGSMIVSDIV